MCVCIYIYICIRTYIYIYIYSYTLIIHGHGFMVHSVVKVGCNLKLLFKAPGAHKGVRTAAQRPEGGLALLRVLLSILDRKAFAKSLDIRMYIHICICTYMYICNHFMLLLY